MSAAPPDRPDPAHGVFETLRVRDGVAQAAAAHLQRLARSVGALYGLPLPVELEAQLRARATALTGEHRLRIDAAPAASGLEFSFSTSAVTPAAGTPVALAPLVVPGGLGAHKWRDRRLLGRPDSNPVALVVDGDGTVLEAAWANFWILDGDRLTTPPADGRILPGVTRARLLALCSGLGLRASEAPVTLSRARVASATMLTSSLRLAVPARLAGAPAPPAAAIATIDRIRAALAGS